MRFRPESDYRPAVAEAVARHRATLEELVPEAAIEHIGATSVPGALTKGDLDLLVSAQAERFDAAVAALRTRYAIHQPENWTARFASFKEDPEGELAVGLQVVVAGGEDERLFKEWRDRLTRDPALLERYNALKLEHAGKDPDAYIHAKARFIEGVIGGEIGG